MFFTPSAATSLKKIYNPRPSTIGADKFKLYHSFPFYNTDTCNMYEHLKHTLSHIYPHINFTFVFKNSLTVRSFFKFKDQLSSDLRGGVIYKYQCGGCQASYIGSTSQKFKTRVDQHLGISSRTSRPLTTRMNSNPRTHSENNNHPINSSNFTIIDTANNTDLLTLESLHIFKNKPTLNTNQCAVQLSIVK